MLKFTKTIVVLLLVMALVLALMIACWVAAAGGLFAGALTLAISLTFMFCLLTVILISKVYSINERLEVNIAHHEGVINPSAIAQENYRRPNTSTQDPNFEVIIPLARNPNSPRITYADPILAQTDETNLAAPFPRPT